MGNDGWSGASLVTMAVDADSLNQAVSLGVHLYNHIFILFFMADFNYGCRV